MTQIDDHEDAIKFNKLFEKLDHSLSNPYFFSKRSIQATYYILYTEIKSSYMDSLIKNSLLPIEYLPFMDYHQSNKKKDKVNLENISLVPLELQFTQNNASSSQ